MSNAKAHLTAIAPRKLVVHSRRWRRWKQNLLARLFRTRYENPQFERWEGPVVFLLGAARSGTTLLSEILGSAEAVDTYAEPPRAFASRLGLSIFDRRFLGLTSIDAIREELFETRRSHLNPNRTYIEKWPGNAFLVHELSSVFPNSRFVHIVRDGRAVADSAFRRYGGEWLTGHLNIFTNLAMNQKGYDSSLPMLARGGLRWRVQVETAIASLSQLPPERSHSFRYEDLRSSPEDVIRQVFRFLELDYDREQVPRIRGEARRPWESWPLEERAAFKSVAGPLLEKLGYANDGDW